MAPPQKKSRPNTDHQATAQFSEMPSQGSGGAKAEGSKTRAIGSTSQVPAPSRPSQTSSAQTPAPAETQSNRNSWYGSAWSAKTPPVAQVDPESVSVAKGVTSESSTSNPRRRPTQYMSTSFRKSSKSVPLAEPTRVNATGSHTEVMKSRDAKGLEKTAEGLRMEKVQEEESQPVSLSLPAEVIAEPPLPPDPGQDGASETKLSQQQPAGWFGGWWSRPDDYSADSDKTAKEREMATASEASATPLPLTPIEDQPSRTFDMTPRLAEVDAKLKPATAGDSTQLDLLKVGKSASARSSWFGLWSTSQNEEAQQSPELAQQSPTPEAKQTAGGGADSTNNLIIEVTPQASQAEQTVNRPAGGSSPRAPSTGWAFWSKGEPQDQAADRVGTQKQVGEIAVADTPSQSHPEAAQFNEQQEHQAKPKDKEKPRSVSGKDAGRSSTGKASDEAATPGRSSPRTRPTTPDAGKAETPRASSSTQKTIKAQQPRPNLIMPSFNDTYNSAYFPTYWERITQYVASSLHISDYPTTANHVFIAPTPPKVKTAIAIGVHGFFPAPLIQKILGQPTGTSIRFANYASAAIRAWTDKYQPDTPCEIDTVALEGEGFIADRVNTLWKLMLNWLSNLRNADLILLACHSQGVPVAIMLVAKLIQLGCLSPNARIGVCAMAGINLGPFAEYQSRLFGGSAAELFEFSRPTSKVSREYASSLEIVLRHGVRITYVGSMDDQLVSLESSLFSNLTHPYVQRAVFVDGRLHAPDFINHLVAFALKLRNLGISDHGLIRELSSPLAGSIYGGEGHSRVYDDAAVYDLALQFALETTEIESTALSLTPGSGVAAATNTDEKTGGGSSERSGIPSSTSIANSRRRGSASGHVLPGVAPQITPYEPPALGANANPYFLPWAMRGILEEEVVKRDMQDEVTALVKLFEDWKPTSKPLRDVKFRLEAVRGKV